MKSHLIKDTTREERERIVAQALGNIEAGCDGCMPGLAEMYQPISTGRWSCGNATQRSAGGIYPASRGPNGAEAACRGCEDSRGTSGTGGIS